MGIWFAFLSALSFTASNLLIKKGMGANQKNNGYFVTVSMNVLFLGVILLIVLAWEDFSIPITWTGTAIFILSGLLTTGLGRITFFSGIERIGPSKASAIKNASPLFSLLFSIVVLHETIGWAPAAGIALILAGIGLQGVWFYATQKEQEKATVLVSASHTREQAGFFFAILSAMSFGIGQGVRKQGLLFLDHAYYGAWVGAVASFLFFVLYEWRRGNLSGLSDRQMWLNPYYLFAGVLTSLGALFFFLGIAHAQVSYVSVIAATEPLLTVLASALFLKKEDRLSLSVWLTAVLILCGSIVIALTI